MNSFQKSFLISLFLSMTRKVTRAEIFTSTFEMEYLVYTSYNMTKELEIHFEKNDLNNKETKK